jgi:glycyl-tRNA synthetase
MMKNTEKTMDKIVTLCKNRGFIFAGSEIYGGLANTWDYGPLGVELKNNLKKAWWKKFVQENPYNVGLDAAILMNPQTWVASGHVGGFSDPLMDCKECKERFRADKVIEDWCKENNFDLGHSVDAMSQAEMKAFVEEHQIPCPTCGKHNWTDIRQFNLMFKTFQGVTEDAKNTVYLRPETAQGIFVNFQNVQRTTRRKLPFGVCQVGKSFRNEITPGNFTFRTREFEQMELEFFCKPGTELEWFSYWKTFCRQWLLDLGMREENLRLRDHDPEELSHYSNATTDFEFVFPFGWGELWGVASRTDFDLTAHQTTSGKDMTYFDQESGEHYIPYVIEPSLGADRVTLAFLVDAYDEEVVGQDKKGNDDVRTVLHLHPALAPFKCAILPLSKKEVLTGPAMELYKELSKEFMVDYDETGSIGKRYRREDEIGTPFCITFDFNTVGTETDEADHCVTIRERDSMEQVRIPITEVKDYIAQRIKF